MLLSTSLLALLSTVLLVLLSINSIHKALLSTCDAVEHVFLQLRVLAFTRLYLGPALLSTCDAVEHVFLQLSVLAF